MNFAFVLAIFSGLDVLLVSFMENPVTRQAFYAAAVVFGLMSIISAIEATARQLHESS